MNDKRISLKPFKVLYSEIDARNATYVLRAVCRFEEFCSKVSPESGWNWKLTKFVYDVWFVPCQYLRKQKCLIISYVLGGVCDEWARFLALMICLYGSLPPSCILLTISQ